MDIDIDFHYWWIVFVNQCGLNMKLTAAEKKRRADGMTILNILSNETSVIQKPLLPSDAANVPENVSLDILSILKGTEKHEVYGSLAMGTKTFAQRKPNDIDMVVKNPKKTASIISQRMSARGHKTNIESNPQFNSHVVQVKKGGEWVDVADIHPIEGHKTKFDVFGRSVAPKEVGGIKVQAARDQLFRKANSVMAYDPKTKTFGAAEHRKQKDVNDFITTSRLLLDSKQLQAEAELAKVAKGRKALKSWRKHAKKIDAGHVRKDPIPERQEQRFINYAVKNPNLDVEEITFMNKTSFNPVEERGKHLNNLMGIFTKPSKKNKFWW